MLRECAVLLAVFFVEAFRGRGTGRVSGNLTPRGSVPDIVVADGSSADGEGGKATCCLR